MKLFTRLYFLQLKQYIKALPLAILGSILFILLTGAASYGIFKYYETPEDNGLVKATVAVVTGDMDDAYLNIGINMLGKMASTSDYFSFTVMDEDDAEKALKKGKIIAIIDFPDGAVESILDGTNDPVNIRFNDSNPLSSVLLTELTKSGATLLSGAQAGTYTTAQLFYDNDMGSKLYDAFNDVDEIGFKLVLKRGSLFDDDGEDSSANATIAYYLGTAVILVLIFFGLTLAGNIYYDNNAYLMLGKTKRGFEPAYYAAKLLTLTTIYYVSIVVLLLFLFSNDIIGQFIGKVNYTGLFINSLLASLFIASFLTMLMFMMPRSMDGILLIFIASIVLTIASGLLIPTAFMPVTITRLHNILPFTGLHSFIVNIIGLGDINWIGIIYTLVFMIIGFILLKIKIKKAA